MEPESEMYPPTDEANDELSLVYLDECNPMYCRDMSFMESLTY